MHREDFNILNTDIIYFDNGATSLKPKCVLDSITKYYNEYPMNAHRGDYKLSMITSNLYEKTRDKVRDFIGAKDSKEIVFTSGTTESLNMIIKGYFKHVLNEGDEVIISKGEHASLLLPFLELEKEIGIKLVYANLDENYKLTLDSILQKVTNKTKVIALSHISNVIGDKRDIKSICELAHKNNILVIVDAAQSLGHTLVDVTSMDIDFLAGSAHKMCGPMGVGILYAKEYLMKDIRPVVTGGGVTVSFSEDEIVYKDYPFNLEAGTRNVPGVIALGDTIDYINSIGVNNIEEYVSDLRKYLITKLSKLDNLDIYNKDIDGTTIIFNVKGVFAQDTSLYLDKKNICVRSGDHCDKMLHEITGVKNTVRVSLYFYNTIEECDKLVEALNNPNILEESLGI
ncbi:MAG: cysteine desulfurase [Bacilli bacterium]|nr:cysteine desulfurase [Bacilli bacterium]